jgi:hypothetical protein
MSLPNTFQFSATSLQDYLDCARRFQLRYLLQVAWPAPKAEPIGEQERHGQLARDFHRLVHQHLLGLPAENLSASIHDLDLERWWQAYLAYVPTFGSAQAIPEIGLSTPLSGYRVMAQYDAIVVGHQRSVEQKTSKRVLSEDWPSLRIVDWKTYRQRPPRAWLGQRLQSRVYPVILVEAGASLIDQARVEPGDVEMCYWLTEYPHDPEIFQYGPATYETDLEYLSTLIAEIDERIRGARHGSGPAAALAPEEVWPLTSDLRHCRFCNYRSLCGRGDVAGPFADYVDDAFRSHATFDETDLGFDLDWGQVQEIVY